MMLEIPLFFYPTDVAVVDDSRTLPSALAGYRTFPTLPQAVHSINRNRFEHGCYGQISVLLVNQSASVDAAINACDKIEDNNLKTILVNDAPLGKHSPFFDLTLNPNVSNFHNILQRKVSLMQRAYFSSASSNHVHAEAEDMHYLYDCAVADHFDDVCRDLSVKMYCYDARISGFILTQQNGEKSLWSAFSAEHFSTDDIAVYVSAAPTRAAHAANHSVVNVVSEASYWCITIFNISESHLLSH